jgi:hypothetical protein
MTKLARYNERHIRMQAEVYASCIESGMGILLNPILTTKVSVCDSFEREQQELTVSSRFAYLAGRKALEIRNGSIYRTATILTTPAMVLLPLYSHFDDGITSGGGVEAFQHISSMHVVLGGLEHDDSADIEVRKFRAFEPLDILR